MTSFVSHTTIDCANAYELSEWWKQLLGYVDIDGDPNLPGHEECMIRDPASGHQVLFIEVPEAKAVPESTSRTKKNGIHLDLRPRDLTQAEEVERLLGIGATQVWDLRGEYGPGTGWVTLADPEGNEFCILRSEAERAAVTPQP